jgi:DNA-binding response OmpR family regulator
LAPRILLVDDDPVLLAMMAAAFKTAGWSTAAAENGRRALAVFDRHEPDLVVTDIVMPEMEGIGLILELKRRRKRPRIVAISEPGRLRTYDYLTWALHLGADEALAKPFRMTELVGLAHRLVPIRSVTAVKRAGG